MSRAGLGARPGWVVQDPHDGGGAQAGDLLDPRKAQPRRGCFAHGVVAAAALPVAQLLCSHVLRVRALHKANGTSPGVVRLPAGEFQTEPLLSPGSDQCPAQPLWSSSARPVWEMSTRSIRERGGSRGRAGTWADVALPRRLAGAPCRGTQ